MFNLLSFVTGKFSVWIITSLVIALVGMWTWVYLLKADIEVVRSKQRETENSLALQTALIESNRAAYEANLESAKTAQERIRVEYRTKVKIIEKWRETNATCSDAISYLNTYNF